ncbi:uncharacterized protein LOC127842590 isoform X2 [Dreissena polymorpha]|uniref:uncharacterized protein LOC127842590 isoform X2 n=1 Tax=Dreissena polymorpha TaxID=45954 RepID=UPI002264A927|nr:uncharacterized protein LOC127842590 isoform X2 [Dreissena polymorpha]
MDLRILCLFVTVVYVVVRARIMCNFQPKSWTSAMHHCLNLSGTPVGVSTFWSQAGLQLNGSFWTANYVLRFETTDSPVKCGYRTMGTENQISQAKLGNCSEIRNYICCDNTMIESCVKNGTWQEASKCNKTYLKPPEQLPVGDYWLRTAFGYQDSIYTDNYTGRDLSGCGPTYLINETSSINETQSTDSIGTALGIGLSVSASIVVIVIFTTVSVCVYKRRHKRKPGNSQVSVRMNVLYDASSRNETLRKPAHIHESYEYAVPGRRRQTDGIRHGTNCIDNEVADINFYTKATANTEINSNKVDVHSREGNNKGFTGDNTVIKSNSEHGFRHVYGNTDVMGDEYDGVTFSDAPDPITINVYSHLGNHGHEDAYNVASCTQTLKAQERLSDYDRLDKH